MRTTVDLDEKLIAQARRATGDKTKTALLEHGLRALIEQAARRRLAAWGGKIPQAKTPPRHRPFSSHR